MHRSRILLASSLLVFVAACAAPVQVGAFKVNKEVLDEGFARVKARAAFDLSCPGDKVQLTLLDVIQGGVLGDNASVIGAEGCGHKATYVRGPGSSWVMNNADTNAK